MRLNTLLAALSALLIFMVGCGTYELPNGANLDDNVIVIEDTGNDGDDQPETDAQAAWESFGTTGTGAYVIDWSVAETSPVVSFPENGWDYVDAESVIVVSPSEGEVHEVTLSDAANTSHNLFLYTEMPAYEKMELGYSDNCDNCKVTALQPDNTVVEINYYGTHNWVLPGSLEQRLSVWTDDPYGVYVDGHDDAWGADAGAHVMTRIGMLDVQMRAIYARIVSGEALTEEEYNLGHNIHVSFDTSILGCFEGATSQAGCHTPLVNDADRDAHLKYEGDLPMGYPLGMPEGFDCLSLDSHFGRMICATAKVHPILPTEASNEDEVPEIQFMLANGLAEVIYQVEGQYPFNNDGTIAADMDRLHQPDGSGLVAIDNYADALQVPAQ